MRPIKLTMKGFGPYAKETVIDFEKLGQKGIYLITGATGTGKTTIFDAIVYALYNRTSGSLRDPQELRSKYALDQDPTEICLEFLYGGKKYKVTRSPKYSRAKKSGEGQTEQQSQAELVLDDETVIVKPTEVTNKITEIIGLDSDQFCKISMLAQGEFRKILTDDSKTRTEIFRKLFHTEKYYRLQEALKERKIRAEKEGKEVALSIEQYIDGIMCKEESYYEAQMEKARNKEMPYEDVLELIENIIKEDEETSNTLTELLTKSDKVRQDLAAKEEIGIRQESMEKAIEKGKARLDELVNAKGPLNEKLKAAEEKLPQAKESRDKASKIEGRLDQYDELETATKEMDVEETREKDLEEKLASLNKALEEQEKTLQDKKEALKGLASAATDKAKAEAEFQSLKGEADKLSTLENERKAYGLKADEKKNAEAKYAKSVQEEREKRDHYQAMRQAYLDDQAGVLAEELEEGKPCLVCGSIHHPKMAQKAENAPTREELDIMEKSYEKARKATEEASKSAGALSAECKLMEENFKKDFAQLFGEEPIDILDENLLSAKKSEQKEALEKAEQSLEEAEKLLETKDALEEAIPVLEAKNEEDKKEANDCAQKLAAVKEKVKGIKSKLESLKKMLDYENKAEAERAIKGLKLEADNIESQLEKCKEDWDNNNLEIERTKSSIETNTQNLSKEEAIDLEEVRTKKNAAEAESQRIKVQQNQISGRLTSNKNAFESMKKKLEESASITKKISVLKELCDTALGEVLKQDKIPLETFIQMSYFDRILDKANLRLAIMTGNQYLMVRRSEQTSGAKKAGLDIDVIDSYNGSKRSATTLSGGELFKASLCLALGMADEVSESAGGIKIDSLFVDEGFGSLDPESINKAMDALENIAEDDRLVGIISHVEELQSRIEKQIVVTREDDGSSRVRM